MPDWNDIGIVGFQNIDSPSCLFGNIRPVFTCVPTSSLCKDGSKDLFWDEYHPTDIPNELIENELIKEIWILTGNQGEREVSSEAPIDAPSLQDSE